MKAIAAGAGVPATEIRNYLYVCQRMQNELEYYIPCTSLADVQVYVELGTIIPNAQSINLVNLCNDTITPLLADKYIIGKDADDNWYGVFTFADQLPPNLFALAIQLTANGVTNTYFSQAYRLENCGSVKKINTCFPVSRADEFGFDLNGIYFGTTTDASNSLGDVNLSYTHYALVRRAKVFQEVPKLSFTANFRRNFRTTVTRQYEFRCEIVPDWYKEYLLAIYTRGFVQVDDTIYQVTDLTFEGVNENDITWKPFAKLQIAKNYQFGCEDCTPKIPCCDITVDTVSQEIYNENGNGGGGDTNPPPPPPPPNVTKFYAIPRSVFNSHGNIRIEIDKAVSYAITFKVLIATSDPGGLGGGQIYTAYYNVIMPAGSVTASEDFFMFSNQILARACIISVDGQVDYSTYSC